MSSRLPQTPPDRGSATVGERPATWFGRMIRSWALYGFLGITVVGFGLVRWGGVSGEPGVLLERFGLLAPLITVLVHAVIAVTPFPSDVPAIANGALYGFWTGTLLSWIGWFAASFVQYAIGRKANREFEIGPWLSRAPAWLRQFPVAHPVFLIGARFLPYVGGHLATIVPGAMGVPLYRFAWCSALAILPQAMVMSGVGAGLVGLGA